jgi:hypothetical protein
MAEIGASQPFRRNRREGQLWVNRVGSRRF